MGSVKSNDRGSGSDAYSLDACSLRIASQKTKKRGAGRGGICEVREAGAFTAFPAFPRVSAFGSGFGSGEIAAYKIRFYNKCWGSEAERLSYTQHFLLLGKKE